MKCLLPETKYNCHIVLNFFKTFAFCAKHLKSTVHKPEKLCCCLWPNVRLLYVCKILPPSFLHGEKTFQQGQICY